MCCWRRERESCCVLRECEINELWLSPSSCALLTLRRRTRCFIAKATLLLLFLFSWRRKTERNIDYLVPASCKTPRTIVDVVTQHPAHRTMVAQGSLYDEGSSLAAARPINFCLLVFDNMAEPLRVYPPLEIIKKRVDDNGLSYH